MVALARTERVRRYCEQIAEQHREYVGYFEKLRVDDDRRWVCAHASGDVLEIGIDTRRQ